MIVRIYDCQDEASSVNGLAVTSDDQLLQVLDGLRAREPFFAELVGENGYELLIGIGGAVGCAQFSRSDGEPPYLMAVAPDPVPEHKQVEFLCGNTPTPVPSRYILPFDKIKDIASQFRRSGRCSTDVSWEEI
jgi:Immunity protein Imm1